MVILNVPSSQAKKNLDHAYPPFALGLPSVFERAGFEVNKKAKSRSSSRSGLRSTSLNGSRATSINGSQTILTGSSPKMARESTPLVSEGPLRSSEGQNTGHVCSSSQNKASMSMTKMRTALADLKESCSPKLKELSKRSPSELSREPSKLDYSPDFYPKKGQFPSNSEQPHHPEPQDRTEGQQHDHEPDFRGLQAEASAASRAIGIEDSPHTEQHRRKTDSFHLSDHSDDFDRSFASLNFNVQNEIASDRKRHGLPPAQYTGNSEEEDLRCSEPPRAPQDSAVNVPLMPQGHQTDGYVDGASPQSANVMPASADPENVLPYPLDQDEQKIVPAAENSSESYHTASDALSKDSVGSFKIHAKRNSNSDSVSSFAGKCCHLPLMPPNPDSATQRQEAFSHAAHLQGILSQGLFPQGMSPHSMSSQSMCSSKLSPQILGPQPSLPLGMPSQAMPPHSVLPHGIIPSPPHSFPPQGMMPQESIIPQAFPGPGRIPHPGMPPQIHGGRPGHNTVPPEQPNQDLYLNAQRRFTMQYGSSTINQTGFSSQDPALKPDLGAGPSPPDTNGIIRPFESMDQNTMGPQLNRSMSPNDLPLGPPPGHTTSGPPMSYPIGGPHRMPMEPLNPPGQGARAPLGPNGQPIMIHTQLPLTHPDAPPSMANPITPTLGNGQSIESSPYNNYYASHDSSMSSQVGEYSNNHTAETSPMDSQKQVVSDTSPLHFNHVNVLGVQNRHPRHPSISSSVYSAIFGEDANFRGSVSGILANSGMHSKSASDKIQSRHSANPSQNSSVTFDFNQPLSNGAPSGTNFVPNPETDRAYPTADRETIPNDMHFEEISARLLPKTQFRSEIPGSLSTDSKTRKQCRACMLLISGKSIRASDKTLSGRWHRECFNCTRCSDSLAGVKKIHVLNDQPFCGRCYHIVNCSTCRSCDQGIEGSCLETRLSADGGQPLLYHAHCLKCAQCQTRLQQTYFDVGGSTFCAEHAFSSLSDVNAVHKRFVNGSMEDVSMDKYLRKAGGSLKTKDKKLRSLLKRSNQSYKDATKEAADLEILHIESAGFLEPENEMEKTFKISQKEILDSVDEATSAKRFTLKLDQLGPYVSKYSQTGNHLLLAGRLGHVSSFNWKEGTLGCELQLGETVHDVQFLQNENEFFAVAQKKHVYIYDQIGAEVHQLVHHVGATRLEYLPYHYLLATAGTTGYIKYQDVSTGQLVAELRGKMGPTTALTHNPYNGVVHSGQNNGTVALWAPNMPSPLVKILSSKGPVRSIAVDRSGNYMAVAGQDKSLKIWDLRSFRPLESYYSPTPASSVSISANGLLAVGWGPHIQVWKDVLTRTSPKVSAPYMNHLIPGQQVQNVAFCPYEDILGVGLSNGFESLIIPGSGEANIDALEANPFSYATRTGRRETQVRGLLEKLQPDMITLDPTDIGRVDSRSNSQRLSAAAQEAEEERKAAYDAQKLAARPIVKKNNSALRRLLRKKTQNVMDHRKLKIQQALEREKKARERLRRDREGIPQEKETGAALRRFM